MDLRLNRKVRSASLILLAAFFLVLSVVPTRAGGLATLVSDLNRSPASSKPTWLTDVNGTLFFVVGDGWSFAELWRSDGTEAGTMRVKASFPGAGGRALFALTNVSGTLFFVVATGNGYELWKSDGTDAGTVWVKLIRSRPDYVNTNAFELTDVNGMLFFVTDEYGDGPALWKSDGTPAGTVRIKSISPVRSGGGSALLYQLTAVKGILFFVANGGDSDVALWTSDGTEAGTVPIKPIDLLNSRFLVTPQLISVGETLFFFADSNSSPALWKSDGTTVGTVSVNAIPPGAYGLAPVGLIDVDGTLFFLVREFAPQSLQIHYTLWKSDGTDVGTGMVAFVGYSWAPPNPSDFTAANGALFFVFQNALWTSDGSAAGTRSIKRIDNAPGDDYRRILAELTHVHGTLFFVAYASNREATLWKSDGTEAGTVPVRSIQHGPIPLYGDSAYGAPVKFQLMNANGTLIFSAFDNAIGEELWKSNGTAGNTVPVKDIRPGTAGSDLTHLTAMHGSLFFVNSDSSTGNSALWKSDGTVNGTTQVKNLVPGASSSYGCGIYSLINVRGTLFFLNENDRAGLWRSDGTGTGTVQVKALAAYVDSLCPDGLVSVDGTLFLSVWDEGALRLWKSAGLEANTVRVTDQNYSPSDLTDVNGTLFFSAGDNTTNRRELWKSDGTDTGTVRVKDTVPAYPSYFINVDGTLFFSAFDGQSAGLWKSDGTAAGTVLLRGGFPDATAWSRTNVLELMNVNSTLYFVANDGTSGMELWKSDGTETGTVLVKDIRVGAEGSSPYALTNVNGSLFFAADDGSSGMELWKSDGTEVGTVRVKDINAGPSGSFPDHLANIYGTLFFAAYDTQNGYELWQSDGSEAGTVIVQDIEPGAASSTPSDITVAGNHLFFNATTTGVGRELWKLPITTLELHQPNLTLIPITPFDPGTSRTGVRVTNFSPIAATDVVLTLTVPAGLSFAAVSPTQGTCSVVDSTLTCHLGHLPGNSTATITTRINPPPAENTLLLATVAAHEADLDMADNTLATIIWWPQVYLPHLSR